MSSLAYAPAAAPARHTAPRWTGVFSERGSDVLLGLAALALAAGLLAFLPTTFSVDSWLALLTGREVWQHGIPTHETLTALAHGRQWVDQQWLSQLASYGIYRLGGLPLLGIANVGLIVTGFAGAILAARRLGAQPRAVMLALPLCTWLLFPSREVRTQQFAVPLFVATVYLLARDSRSPSRRVYWCLPLLALWANLHGTVTLGVMLVGLYALTLAWNRRRAIRHCWRASLRPLTLMLGAPLCLLATPYGLAAISYYRTMLVGSSLRHTVTEWQAITSVPLTAAPFFVAAGILVWSFGRWQSRTTMWERLVMVALIAGAISVIRNVLFFALAALIVTPLSLKVGGRERGRTRPDEAADAPRANGRRARLNMLATAAGVLAVAVLAFATLTEPAARIELSFQRMPLLAAVQRATAADPTLKVFAEVRFADWLLWRDPALSGRVASDARFELLSSAQMSRLQSAYGALGSDWKQGAIGFRLVVLDRRYEPDTVTGFRREPGARVLYDDGERVVLLRARSSAA